MRMAFPGSLYARLSGAKADNYQEKIRLKSYCLSVNETPNTRRTPRFKKLKLNGDSMHVLYNTLHVRTLTGTSGDARFDPSAKSASFSF